MLLVLNFIPSDIFSPFAVNDGKTKYGYRFKVKANDGYQLASDLKVIYNDEDVTSTVEVTRWPWGAYVTVDLGKAIETPVVYYAEDGYIRKILASDNDRDSLLNDYASVTGTNDNFIKQVNELDGMGYILNREH